MNKIVKQTDRKLSYIEKKRKSQSILWYGVSIAILSFIIHLVLQALTRSVLSQSVPQFMMPSYFSTISLYVLVAFIMYIVYMMRYFDLLTFAEISANKWYTLAKNGYDPLKMILTKLLIRLKEIVIYYTIGYIVTILLTMLLQYPFIVNYMISLYMVGLVDIIFVTVVTMECSLFITEQRDARYVIVISAIIIWILRLSSGYYNLISDPVSMQNITHLFDYFGQSNYLFHFLIVVIIALITLVVRAQKISQYTNFPFYEKDMDLDDGVRIVIPKQDSYEDIVNQFVRNQRHKGFDQLVMTVLIAAITCSIVVNLFVLYVSTASPEKKSEAFGKIAYIVETDEMEPDLLCNDLAFFDSIGRTDEVYENEIILYETKEGPRTGFIKTIDENHNMVVETRKHTAQKQDIIIRKEDVYGTLTGRNPWLGVLLLFANTIFGRLLCLLIPALLLYYYKPIKNYLRRRGMSKY